MLPQSGKMSWKVVNSFENYISAYIFSLFVQVWRLKVGYNKKKKKKKLYTEKNHTYGQFPMTLWQEAIKTMETINSHVSEL